MGIYEFLTLSHEEQWDTLWDEGIYLTQFKSIDCYFQLYAIDRFFVELELCPIRENILNMGVFVHGKKMDKYVTDTDFGDLKF
ncbi:hypothetical protein [Flagellimonas sp.]|jgi:hypothetical protein|uniref:hypothetical protein n=1 Tax=Flagellimonas sp. TaxID=2058762 RepID=UPI003BAB5663